MKYMSSSLQKYYKIVPPSKKNVFLLFLTKAGANLMTILMTYMASKIIEAITLGDIGHTIYCVLIFGVVCCGEVFFYYFNLDRGTKDSLYSSEVMRDQVFTSVSNYDFHHEEKVASTKVIQFLSTDLYSLSYINDNMSDFFILTIELVIMFGLVISIDVWSGILIVVFCLIYLFSCFYLARVRALALKRQKKCQDRICEILRDTLVGKLELKVYGMKDTMRRQLVLANHQFERAYWSKRLANDAVYTTVPLITYVGRFFLYFVLLYQLFQGRFGVERIVLMIGYYAILLTDIGSYAKLSRLFLEKSVYIQRLFDIVSYHSSDMLTFGDYDQDDILGMVQFRQVFSSYQNKPVLKNVSFVARPHELTTLVGKSGSGKTTVINLLLRLYPLDQGSIYIDGESLFQYSNKVYFSNVSVINQKPFVFSMSISDNLGLVDSNRDHQIEVCKRLGIHEEILSLERGYQTVLKQNGTGISTELKQLLSIARSLLSNAEILLFDEVTSSLDDVSTKRVASIILELKKDHTILMITHKPELMRLADHMVILDHGMVVGDGTVEELVDNPYYLRLQKYE